MKFLASQSTRIALISCIYLALIGRFVYKNAAPERTGISQAAINHELKLTSDKNTVFVAVQLIWTNDKINRPALDAIQSFRMKYPQVVLIHNISPALIIGKNSPENIAAIKTIMRPHDHLGIYLAPELELLSHLEITPRLTPNLWGTAADKCHTLCASTGLLSGYATENLHKMINWSKQQLQSTFAKDVTFFQSHDWSADSRLGRILEAAGISYNANPIVTERLRRRLEGFSIFADLETSWSFVTPDATVFRTPDSQAVQFVPDLAGPVDYTTADTMRHTFDRLVKRKPAGDEPKVFVTTTYLSTVSRNIGKIHLTMGYIMAQEAKTVTIKPLPLTPKLQGHTLTDFNSRTLNTNTGHLLTSPLRGG